MAAKTSTINEILKECKVLLLDVEGTTTSVSFVKDKLYKYAEHNVPKYLEDEWESDVVKQAVVALRAITIKEEDRSDAYTGELPADVPAEDAPKADQIVAIVQRIKWQMHGPKNLQDQSVNVLLWHVWKNGYDAGDLKGHVFEDVLPTMEQWRSVEGQKVYIYSSGSVEAQKMLFGKSEAGDLLCHIDGHFDTAVGTKQESGSYTAIAEKIECKPNEILFLTDIYQEAEAANKAGLHAALMVREGNAPLPSEATDKFPQLTSMLQVIATQKRKLPDQEKESPAPPAKVAKIVEAGSTTETEVLEEKTAVETMEVDIAPVNEKKPEEQNEETSVQAEAAVVKVADTNEASLPVVDVKSVVEENIEKMDEDVSPDADSSKKDEEPVITPKDNTAVVTEKEEVSEKLLNAEKTEISEVNDVENTEPAVEQTDAESEAVKLQNVGDVLEKECDDLLSKVNDVTNLEKMKPLLPTVSEELSGENGDTSDIVESILDSELELEIKQAEAEAKVEKEKKEDALVDSTDNTETEKTDAITEIIEKPGEDDTILPDEEAIVSSVDDKDEETKSATEVDIDKNDEPQVNGKSNSSADVAALNGDSNKENELKARLGVENGNGDTNGSAVTDTTNGSEVTGNGDGKNGTAETEVAEIKVKTVVAEDAEPIEKVEQPTET